MGGTAARGIAAGVDVIDRGFLGAAPDLDGAPFRCLQIGLGILMIGLEALPSAMMTRSTGIGSFLPVVTGRRLPDWSGSAQLHHVQLSAGHKMGLIVTDEFTGRPQNLELNPSSKAWCSSSTLTGISAWVRR